jgi:hypothetical protein
VSSRVPSGSRSWRSPPSTLLRVPPLEVERFKHRQLAPTVGHRHDHRRIRRIFSNKIIWLWRLVRFRFILNCLSATWRVRYQPQDAIIEGRVQIYPELPLGNSACSSGHIIATHASIKTNQLVAIQLRCLLSGSCMAQRIRRVRHKEGRTTRSGTAHTTLTRSPGLLFSVPNSGTKLPTRQARNRVIMWRQLWTLVREKQNLGALYSRPICLVHTARRTWVHLLQLLE